MVVALDELLLHLEVSGINKPLFWFVSVGEEYARFP